MHVVLSLRNQPINTTVISLHCDRTEHTITSSTSSGAVPRRAAVVGPAGELAMEVDGLTRMEERGDRCNRNEEQKLGLGSHRRSLRISWFLLHEDLQ